MRFLIFILLFNPLLVWSQMDTSILLIGRNTGTKIMSSGDTIKTMGFAQNLLYSPTVPGPTLEFLEGDSVEIDLWNISQGAPHTIHLHGLDVDQQNDGVPHLSFDVGHMDHGYYYMKAPHPGTYLYHCHVVSSIHVQAGMYGLIVIHPSDGSKKTWTGGYDYDVSLPLLFSEIDTTWHNDSIMKHDHDTSLSVHYVQVPDYHPQYYLVNGLSDGHITDSALALTTSAGAVNYVRLANIGYKGVRVIFPGDFGAFQISSDGRPLPAVYTSDTVEVYPGERYGVLGSMSAEGISQIAIEYFDLNTGTLENTQYIPIEVEGYVNIPELESSVYDLKILPNPNDGNFTVSVANVAGHRIQLNLVSLKGEILQSTNLEAEAAADVISREYSVENLNNGVYILQLIVDDVNVDSKKFLLQK